ncbi:MAG: hypothetical protein ACLTEE_05655 [Anaerobutyricum hallii]
MKFDNYMDPRKTFGKAVTQEAEKNEDIVVLSADSGKSSGFGEFIEKYPDRYFECGIMEQGVIGISSGLATTGKVPVFCAIAPFVTARPFEMFRNDLGYMNQNVKVVGRNCGITYSRSWCDTSFVRRFCNCSNDSGSYYFSTAGSI